MAGFFKRNWDLILAHILPLVAIAIVIGTLATCSDWDCLGGLILAFFVSVLSFIFLLIALIRNFFVRKPGLRWFATGILVLVNAVPYVLRGVW